MVCIFYNHDIFLTRRTRIDLVNYSSACNYVVCLEQSPSFLQCNLCSSLLSAIIAVNVVRFLLIRIGCLFCIAIKVPRCDFLQLTAAHLLSLQLRTYGMVQNPLDTRDKTLFTECQATFVPPGIPLSVEFARRSLRIVAIE